jgi:hypothetical protein
LAKLEGVVQCVGRVVDIHSELLGNCNVSVIRGSFLVDIRLSWDVNVDVGLCHNLIVNTSKKSKRCIVNLLDRCSNCGKCRVVGSKNWAMSAITLGVSTKNKGGGRGQAVNDGKNDLERK